VVESLRQLGAVLAGASPGLGEHLRNELSHKPRKTSGGAGVGQAFPLLSVDFLCFPFTVYCWLQLSAVCYLLTAVSLSAVCWHTIISPYRSAAGAAVPGGPTPPGCDA
jgi:hypothetical protein